jgi:hypothetical protein
LTAIFDGRVEGYGRGGIVLQCITIYHILLYIENKNASTIGAKILETRHK